MPIRTFLIKINMRLSAAADSALLEMVVDVFCSKWRKETAAHYFLSLDFVTYEHKNLSGLKFSRAPPSGSLFCAPLQSFQIVSVFYFSLLSGLSCSDHSGLPVAFPPICQNHDLNFILRKGGES